MNPNLSDEILAWAVNETREWIDGLRETHRPDSLELAADMKDQIRTFFQEDVFERARARSVPSIPNPPFLEAAAQRGIPVERIDFSQMSGLTAIDTILLSEAYPSPDPLRLVFHELVHVVQYEVLGVAEFARKYVYGIAEGDFEYYRIPLEVMAYDLERRFAERRDSPFAVLDEVRRALDWKAS